ncbi:MAG TPA: DNA repair protein RecN [Dermatophilaceae bacterium]|nr:DNA repair protein RecN [Dermatophilaceae bacterium]
MLQEIRIRGLGVIDDALLAMHPGLTVLTGETGAGKTMVVQGLGLLLGSRADAGLVRAGGRATVVEGIVTLPADHPARERALEAGGELDGDELVLARTVTAEGRSRAHVGGRSAPVGVLAELGEQLVAVHGQADQWRLRRPDQHRDVVDAAGGPTLAEARAAYHQAYAAWTGALAERDRLAALDRDRTREVDLLTAGLEHVEQVDPQPGEDVALRAEDERLAHGEGLREAAQAAYLLVAGGEGSEGDGPPVTELVHRGRAALAAVVRHDPRLAALDERLAELGYLAADLGGDLAAYLADLDVDPARLAWVQQRRADLGTLTRRYGDTVDEVLDWAKDAARRLDELLTADERLAALETEVAELAAGARKAGERLTRERRRAGEAFAAAVSDELAHLAMGSARVQVAVTEREPGPHGADEVEIQLAANSGAPARSVAKAASGGELSRLMLAIEVVSGAGPTAGATGGGLPTFVFDEVDAGIGGQAALDVGARLARLAERAQVVVVTHLAQVAAFADRHLVVRKADDGSVTASAVTEVAGEQRVSELARMMGGGQTAAALAHARELLEHAGRSAR